MKALVIATFFLAAVAAPAAAAEIPGDTKGAAGSFVSIDADKIVLENSHFRYVLSIETPLMFKEIRNKYVDDDFAKGNTTSRPFILVVDGSEVEPSELKVQDLKVLQEDKDSECLEVTLAARDLLLQLSVSVDESPESCWTLTIKNLGKDSKKVRTWLPVFRGLRLGEKLEDNLYLCGTGHHGWYAMQFKTGK